MPDDQNVNSLERLAAAEEAKLQEMFPGAFAEATETVPAPVETRAPIIAPDAPAVPEAPAAPAAEVPPVAAAPEAPAAPAAEAPPAAEVQAAPHQQATPSWKQVREAEKLARNNEQELLRERQRTIELEREMAVMRAAQQLAAQQQPQNPEDFEVNPLAELAHKQQQLEAQVARQAEESMLSQQATAFSREHPDYEDAFRFYVDKERTRADGNGEMATTIHRLQQSPQGANVVRQAAVQRGITEHEAASHIAFELLYEQRRQRFSEAARITGKTVPELLYEDAKAYGFTGNAPAPAPAAQQSAAPQAPNPLSAADRVRQDQSAAAASSVGNMTREGTAPPAPIRSRNDLMMMEQRAREQYIDRMDQQYPGWERSLT